MGAGIGEGTRGGSGTGVGAGVGIGVGEAVADDLLSQIGLPRENAVACSAVKVKKVTIDKIKFVVFIHPSLGTLGDGAICLPGILDYSTKEKLQTLFEKIEHEFVY